MFPCEGGESCGFLRDFAKPPSQVPTASLFACHRLTGFSRSRQTRNETGNLLHIGSVTAGVLPHQVALFEHLNSEEDVARRYCGKQEMPCSHHRSRPEGDQEPDLDGVPDKAVEAWRPKAEIFVRCALDRQPRLAQSKEIEVVDHHRRQEDDCPTGPEGRLEDSSTNRVFDRPDDFRHWTPLPIHQEENGVGREDVRTTLHLRGKVRGQYFLEPLAGHPAVLYRESAEQQTVDDDCRDERRRCPAGIERVRHENIADKPDRV